MIFIAIVFVLIAPVIPVYFIAKKQFSLLLERTDNSKWSRGCSTTDDPQQLPMYNEGLKWGEKHKVVMEEVSIRNDGFKLCGQYFDFKQDRAVIIVAGRTEGCIYSYYFAKPYKDAGFNVLVIDNRSHGLSEGHYNSLGLKEYKDIIAWGKFLHNKKGNKEVVCHGICIGSATILYALTSAKCPKYMDAMVADGMYTTFGESFKQHLKQDHRPVFPFIQLFFMIVKAKTGVNAYKYGPEDVMGKMNKRILFIHSKEDVFSVPSKTYEMYEKCPSADKKFVFFDHGRHSFVRFTDP